jgi:hypothetical protein
MPFHLTETQLIVAAVVLVFLIIVAVVGFEHRRKTRTKAFRNRFGTEYDREVTQHGSVRKAEAKLADRETRVEALKIRELGATERERFLSEWQTVQSRFVDHPHAAVTEADNFEQRAENISVTYPRVMENYRVAHAIVVRPGRAEASTEELRTAMIQYRTIFDELVQAQRFQEKRTAA